MRVTGITGGIGSGKSVVTAYLIDKGYDVIDADSISRSLSDDRGILEEIRSAFGDGVFDHNGALDRKKLADAAFAGERDRKTLEKIITEKVKTRASEIIDTYRRGKDGYLMERVFFDAPLLFETGADDLTDDTWLVTAADDIRLKRVMKRDGLTEQEVQDRMRSQMPEQEKEKRADHVIRNDGSIDDLYLEVDRLL